MRPSPPAGDRRARTHHPRTAVVTGAARGIGAATAKRLAADGHRVAVLDLDAARCADTVAAITDAGGQAIGVGVDVADADQVAAAVAQVAEALGAPTILVNNAGITRDNLIFKMTEQDWDAVIGVHLRGSFLMTRAVQGHMTQERFGRIVNLSSTSAQGNRGQVNYSAAKAGLQGFTKTLAIELGRFGVGQRRRARVHPDRHDPRHGRAPGGVVRGLHRPQRQGDPGQRVGQPEDIAATISFLTSDEAGFVSGQVIYVAGGPMD